MSITAATHIASIANEIATRFAALGEEVAVVVESLPTLLFAPIATGSEPTVE